MNTFLPYPSFRESAKVLDRQRLGKQRLEVLQLLKALDDARLGWHNHPAAKMWRGSKDALAIYGMIICSEWSSRGYRDNLYIEIEGFLSTTDLVSPPSWLGNPAFHASHRANLLRKDPIWYGRFGWKESILLPYEWPINGDLAMPKRNLWE